MKIVEGTALVCGAGGFIGTHLVRHLKHLGWWVMGVDAKQPQWSTSTADEFMITDLTELDNCAGACCLKADHSFQWIFQLAADMGGMGYIQPYEHRLVPNNLQINMNMARMASWFKPQRFFFSSSVCVYPNMARTDDYISEEAAYPANPDNEYGWEKLMAERVYQMFARREGLPIRIGRFFNTYGPDTDFEDPRAKAPAALCRKAIHAPVGGELEVWGDGQAVRCFTYIDDLIEGIVRLMRSNIDWPVNIGNPIRHSVSGLAACVLHVANKNLRIKHVEGIEGVASRNFTVNYMMKDLGWKPRVSLHNGIPMLYDWVEAQIRGQDEE